MIVVSDTSVITSLIHVHHLDLLQKLHEWIAGLLALMVDAKRLKLIHSVREIVKQLEDAAGFCVSNAVKVEAFHAANE